MATPFDSITPAAVPFENVVPATEPQLKFVRTLLGERNWRKELTGKTLTRVSAINVCLRFVAEPTEEIAQMLAGVETEGERLNVLLTHCGHDCDPEGEYAWKPLTKKGASNLLDSLLAVPMSPEALTEVEERNVAAAKQAVAEARKPAQWESVVEGRYAIPTEDGAINELAFYKVDRPTEGRWAGYVFVKRLVGPEEQRLSQKQGAAILAKIGEFGAEKASKLYGKEIGHCGVCGRRLTNDESREAGIGPICAQGLGW